MNEPEKQNHVFFQNPFYDTLFGTFRLDGIPSKRVRYQVDDVARVLKLWERESALRFNETIARMFHDGKDSKWPLAGPLFMSLAVLVPEHEFETRDVDNLAKTVIDSLKGIAYSDDAQIVSLFVRKARSDDYGFFVGLRRVPQDDDAWYVPGLHSSEPYPGQEWPSQDLQARADQDGEDRR